MIFGGGLFDFSKRCIDVFGLTLGGEKLGRLVEHGV